MLQSLRVIILSNIANRKRINNLLPQSTCIEYDHHTSIIHQFSISNNSDNNNTKIIVYKAMHLTKPQNLSTIIRISCFQHHRIVIFTNPRSSNSSVVEFGDNYAKRLCFFTSCYCVSSYKLLI